MHKGFWCSGGKVFVVSGETRDVVDQLDKVIGLFSEHIEIEKKILWEAATNRRSQDIIRLAAAAPILDQVQEFADEVQTGFRETLAILRDEEASFSRFGDGEMKLMLRPDYKLRFQRNSPALSAALKDVLLNPADDLLVGFPHVYRTPHWVNVWCDVWGQMAPLLQRFHRMGNSHVSRPVFFEYVGKSGVDDWRQIWDRKSVVVVTGRQSRFRLTDALFGNCKSTALIESLPVDAFDDLTRVEHALSKDASDLVLISLGPAGTVLANQLARIGRRAIDIGHITDSFENVFEGGLWPENKSPTNP